MSQTPLRQNYIKGLSSPFFFYIFDFSTQNAKVILERIFMTSGIAKKCNWATVAQFMIVPKPKLPQKIEGLTHKEINKLSKRENHRRKVKTAQERNRRRT
jgi:hypothetical protein